MVKAMRVPNVEIWWIDESGIWHAADDGYIERFPDCAFPDLTQHQGPWFREFGMIKVARLGRIIDIQWDVLDASDLAVRSVFDFLLSFESCGAGNMPVALKYFYGAWNREAFGSTSDALDRMADLSVCEKYQPVESITIAAVCLENTGASQPGIRNALQLWQETGGRLADRISAEIMDIRNRSFSMRPDAHGERFVITAAGPGCLSAALLGEDWHEIAPGMTPQRCFSDEMYEDEMCQDYPDVLQTGVPRLDHIRAFFHLAGEDPIWLNYERLLLPWKTPAGSPVLMCCAEETQHLEIDFLDVTVGDSLPM